MRFLASLEMTRVSRFLEVEGVGGGFAAAYPHTFIKTHESIVILS